MTAIEHELAHFYQPTNVSCAQSAGAMILSALGRQETPTDVLKVVPVINEEWGTLAPALATWFLREGYAVKMFSSDFQLLDLSWGDLPKNELVDRIRAALEVRVIDSLGKDLTQEFLKQYIDFVAAGGVLGIRPFIGTDLIDELLEDDVIFANVSPNVMLGYGRSRSTGLRTSVLDDLSGSINTHFVVIYGRNDDGSYLVADSMNSPGRHVIGREQLICAITAGQIQCENAIFQVSSNP